ncbi:hypothetical protein [Endozoicomonas euniceicola]|uniref:Uncharacterized protein n=1 Tax=Endozoicomonas euniceicola TaxID=1234143 RepID=A0ABY6H0L2_9GAMM|nr:hypothetical protein [Endozoicomonas euniceicola]UYM18591.1 hypothetical protein NX720_12045 [Endozoicomonas euniceicola]
MSEKIDKYFEKLTERKITDKERLLLYKIKDTLGLKNDDAVWSIFIALNYHLRLYEKIPNSIEDVINHTSDNLQKEVVKSAKEAATKTCHDTFYAYTTSFQKELDKLAKTARTEERKRKGINFKSYFVALTTQLFFSTFFMFLGISIATASPEILQDLLTYFEITVN